LRFYEHQVDKQHHEIMLHVFVREPFAARALRQSHSAAQRPVVRRRVGRVERLDRVPAFDTYWHGGCAQDGSDARGGVEKVLAGVGARGSFDEIVLAWILRVRESMIDDPLII
jgi:hypothetical protein